MLISFSNWIISSGFNIDCFQTSEKQAESQALIDADLAPGVQLGSLAVDTKILRSSKYFGPNPTWFISNLVTFNPSDAKELDLAQGAQEIVRGIPRREYLDSRSHEKAFLEKPWPGRCYFVYKLSETTPHIEEPTPKKARFELDPTEQGKNFVFLLLFSF